MYHKLIILALLLLFLFPEKSNSRIILFSPMEISDALPVQFWLEGCATYNEHFADGVHHKCFCAPWQCDDNIKIQFKDTPSQSFSLLVVDEDEVILSEIEIEETSVGVYELNYVPSSASPEICDEKIKLKIQVNASEVDVPFDLPPLTDYDTTTGTPPTLAGLASWVNAGGPNPGSWTLSATPDVSVNGNGGPSGYVAGAISTLEGFDYEFDIQFEIVNTGGASPVIDVTFALLNAGFVELDTTTINYTTYGVKNPNFTLNGSGNGTYLAMRITNDTPVDTKTFELQAASYTPGPVTHEWTLGATPSVDLFDSSVSETLWVDESFTIGVEYTITVNFTLSTGIIGLLTVAVTNGAFTPQFSENTSLGDAGASTSDPLVFVATAQTTRITVQANVTNAVTITINSTLGTTVQTVGSTQIIAKTDCLDIREDHPNTVLLTYSNNRNFAGLVYENISPENEFQIRIPAIFFHQKFPEEDEVMELSSSLLTLNGTLRKQRLLDTDYVPYYFHEKLKLILKHQLLTIFSRLWVKQETYEIVEGDRKWPIKKAKVWLSERNFVHRNIL